jgi:hypothetical protein
MRECSHFLKFSYLFSRVVQKLSLEKKNFHKLINFSRKEKTYEQYGILFISIFKNSKH